MKKLFTSLIAVLFCLVMVAPVMANGASSDAYQGTNYEVGSYYSADSPYFTMGHANSKVFAPEGNDYAGTNVAYGWSSQKVRSNASAFGPCGDNETAETHGYVEQYSGAYVDLGNSTWAEGGQVSGAGYYAFDEGQHHAHVHGMAKTTGGTLVGAVVFDNPNSQTAMSGAVTGSMGNAHVGCQDRETYTMGMGEVAHSTFAQKDNGMAWTYGDASYNYETNGYNHAHGAGFAATGGISNVTVRPNGSITARSMSGSFSSTGSGAYTEGGTHISSFDMN